MTLPVKFTPTASADIVPAFDWYAGQRQELARRFLADLDGTIERISENPLIFPAVRAGVRRASMRRFPYGLFFRVFAEDIQVIACLHTRRNPAAWRARTRE